MVRRSAMVWWRWCSAALNLTYAVVLSFVPDILDEGGAEGVLKNMLIRTAKSVPRQTHHQFWCPTPVFVSWRDKLSLFLIIITIIITHKKSFIYCQHPLALRSWCQDMVAEQKRDFMSPSTPLQVTWTCEVKYSMSTATTAWLISLGWAKCPVLLEAIAISRALSHYM